jgi:endonuclease-3
MSQIQEILTRLADNYPKVKTGLRFNSAYELLLATILSAQTTDRQVNNATPELFSRYPAPKILAGANHLEVATLIKGVGLHRTKASYLIATAKALMDSFEGEVPQTLDELLTLPGVGPKTAKVVLANAFNKPALAVDTHVFRVARRLGLSRGKTPKQVEKELEAVVPREQWIAVHNRLIQHGRAVCHARRPLCYQCCFKNNCDYAASHFH